MSNEHYTYIKKYKNKIHIIVFFQILITVLLIFCWELLSNFNIINDFLYSKPSKIILTLKDLYISNSLTKHIYITFSETLIGFFISSILSFIIASILWWNEYIRRIFDPFISILNSLPKVALGPIIIIWFGASTKSIIFMSLLISFFVSLLNILNCFIQTDKRYITLMKSLNASKLDIFLKVVVPYNSISIINTLKINISMSFIGIIMGELLVSKEGLGYLIMYGSQVFNINLVITSTFILAILSYLMYMILNLIEKYLIKKKSK